MKTILLPLLLTTLAGVAIPAARLAQPSADDPRPNEGALKVPESLRLRHEAFIAEFTRATKDPGKVGDAARAIEKLAVAHFAKGKEVFKPLGLLPLLAEGQAPPDRTKAREIAESLRENLPQIRREHRDLIAGLKKLEEAAKEDAKPEYAAFAERLILHIREEEEVLYPAVLLVGETLKQKPDKK
jgi:hypothetical protein